jgi:hypothetical protein
MYILLTEISIWLATLLDGDGGDGTAEVDDGAGYRTRSNDMAKTFFIC